MRNFYKYLFFLILGIILYILLNSQDSFSVGGTTGWASLKSGRNPKSDDPLDYKFYYNHTMEVEDVRGIFGRNNIIVFDDFPIGVHGPYTARPGELAYTQFGDVTFTQYQPPEAGGGLGAVPNFNPPRRGCAAFPPGGGGGGGSGAAGGVMDIAVSYTTGGAEGAVIQAVSDEVIILDLMTPATREYLSGPGSNWIEKTMRFGSALDENFLICIQALVSSGESRGDSKVSVFVGQAYFILLSLFFTNSTLIFVDVNIHLLEAMKNIIDNFQNIESFDELFTRMETENLREVYQSRHDLQKVKEFLSTDDEGILFQRCKQNFLDNTYVLCEASITDDPLLGYLNSYTLDYFSITNLHTYYIPNFWETINRLQTDYPGLLFIASNGTTEHQYIFQYDSSQLSVFTTDNPNIFDSNIMISGEGWRDRTTQFYSQYDFVKYVYIIRNDEQIIFKNTL